MSEIARELLSLARHGDGGTVPLNGLPLPSTGFYVGGRIPSLIMSVDDVESRGQHVATLQSVINFVSRAGTPYVGVWRDNESDKIYFDAVEWYANEYTACAVARVRKELAVWDIDHGRELRLAYVEGE